jgi:hypothetical protein
MIKRVNRNRSADPSLWDRLDMDRLARNIVDTARRASAEHLMQRVRRAADQRDGRRAAVIENDENRNG